MLNVSGKTIEILDAGVLDMTYLPDFGRVEGSVRLILRRGAAQRPERATILTSVAIQSGESIASVRQRLASDAVRLWHLTEQPGTAIPEQEYELPHAA